MFQSGERPSTPLAVSPKKASTNWSTCTTNSYGSHTLLIHLILGKQVELEKNLPEPSLCGGDVIFIKATVIILPTCFLTSAAAAFVVRSIWIQIHPTKWRCNMRIWLEGKPYSTFKTKHWKLQKWCLVDYVHLFLFPVMIYRFHVSFQVLYHPKINWL